MSAVLLAYKLSYKRFCYSIAWSANSLFFQHDHWSKKTFYSSWAKFKCSKSVSLFTAGSPPSLWALFQGKMHLVLPNRIRSYLHGKFQWLFMRRSEVFKWLFILVAHKVLKPRNSYSTVKSFSFTILLSEKDKSRGSCDRKWNQFLPTKCPGKLFCFFQQID